MLTIPNQAGQFGFAFISCFTQRTLRFYDYNCAVALRRDHREKLPATGTFERHGATLPAN